MHKNIGACCPCGSLATNIYTFKLTDYNFQQWDQIVDNEQLLKNDLGYWIIMFKLLYPKIYVNSILDIPVNKLKKINIRAFILDLDNTVTEWNSDHVREEIIEWLTMVKNEGFKLCILSNNNEKRVQAIAESLGIPFIHRAQKPRRKSFYRAVSLLGVVPQETAVIGDQVFTDVLGGNRAGLFTILVAPMNRKEFLGTKISRSLESFLLRRLKRMQQNDELY